MGMIEDIDTRIVELALKRPRVNGRKTSAEEYLRVVAMRTARVQFAAHGALDLIHEAERLYEWLKHGKKPDEAELVARVEALSQQGMHLFTACAKAGVDPRDYHDMRQRVMDTARSLP